MPSSRDFSNLGKAYPRGEEDAEKIMHNIVYNTDTITSTAAAAAPAPVPPVKKD
jgi:hypothetical protein